jgi:putative ABC transport system permease protein
MRPLIHFLRVFYWFSIRQLLRQYWRTLAVLFGIALGASVFGSVRLGVDASLDSFHQSMDLISGGAHWTVNRPGGRVSEDLVSQLHHLPFVETASPLITIYVTSTGEENGPFLLMGLDPILDLPLRPWQMSHPGEEDVRLWLKLLAEPGSVFLTEQVARRIEAGTGASITLEHVQQSASFRVLGILASQGLALVEGGYVGVTDISTMQEFMGLRGYVDRIDLRLTSRADADDIRIIQGLLPEGVRLESPSETKESALTMIRAYQLNLSILSFVSLFVGMFLVYSLVSLNAAARRRELAIFLSVGGSARFVFGLILSEGLILGIFGWLLAIPLGSVLVNFLLEGISTTITNLFVKVHVEGLRLDVWEILLSLFITLLISIIAAYRPAREATRIAPREAFYVQIPVIEKTDHIPRLTWLALLLVALSWPLSNLPNPPGFPLWGYVGIFLLVVGASMLSPAALRWTGSRLPALLWRFAGEPAFLATRYLRDAGQKTAISIGALVTAMALFVSLVIMIHSFRTTLTLWVNQTLAGDFFLRPKMAGLNNYRDPLPDEVKIALKGIQGDVELLPYRRFFLKYEGMPYQLELAPIEVFFRYGNFIMMDGQIEKIRGALNSGKGVLVSEAFAQRTHLNVGEVFRAELSEHTIDVPILGIFRDYRTRGGLVFASLEPYQRLTGDEAWGGVRFFFKNRNQDLEAAASNLKSRILECCSQPHSLEMASGGELRQEVLRIFDETFAVTTVLLLITILVAGLGITTTLTLLVLERMRQINTLSAIGASSRQIQSMIFWEAILMVSLGEFIGIVCGFLLSYFLIYIINLHSFGWTFIYSINWKALLLSLPLILATALAAALPAVHLVLRSSPAAVLKEH